MYVQMLLPTFYGDSSLGSDRSVPVGRASYVLDGVVDVKPSI